MVACPAVQSRVEPSGRSRPTFVPDRCAAGTRLVDDGDWAEPGFHLRNSDRSVPGVISDGDDVQPGADVWGAFRYRATAARIRTSAFREDLIRRGIKHDERVVVFHALSVLDA
jgi:hypothetical protein